MGLDTEICYINEKGNFTEVGYWRNFHNWMEYLSYFSERNEKDPYAPRKILNVKEFVDSCLSTIEKIYKEIRFTTVVKYDENENIEKEAYLITHDGETFTLYDKTTLDVLSLHFHDEFLLNERTTNKLYVIGDDCEGRLANVIENYHDKYMVTKLQKLLEIRKALLSMKNNPEREYWVINSY